jgi:hypothetical protein
MNEWRSQVVVYDIIDNPPHYSDGRNTAPIDVIEDWQLGFHLGNALKYISRAGHKDYCGSLELSAISDIEKAIWYLLRYRNQLASLAGGFKQQKLIEE